MAPRRGGFTACFVAKLLCPLVVSIVGGACAACANEPELPPGVGPLPDMSKGSRAGAIVTAQHAQQYRMVLPPEVASMLDRGEFAFEAVRAPREPARFIMPRHHTSLATTVSSTGVISHTEGGKALVSPVFEAPRGAFGDSTQVAYKVLWNSASAMWRYNSFAETLSLLIFKTSEDVPRKLEFEVERIHPRKMGEVVGTLEPIFRERISAKKPAAIQNLAWLTLRFFGSGEDFVWASSPVINQIRQLTGSNRSDALFSGVFAPDDLFVWSGKVEMVEPSGLTQMQMLVPLIELPPEKKSATDGCIAWSFGGGGEMKLNYRVGRFKGAGGWVPTNSHMSLRAVWRMDLASRDPFSLDARQTLYVDRDSGLPVYRVVWDDSGRLRRVAIGILRVVPKYDGTFEPIVAGQIVISGSGAGRLVMVTDSFSTCQGYPSGTVRADFDPSTFVRFDKVTPTEGREKG